MRTAVRHPLGVLLCGVLVAAACGIVVHPRVFVLAAGLLAVAAVGVAWPWLSLRGVRAELGFDRDRTGEGEEVGVLATVTNPLPWPAAGLEIAGNCGLSARLASVPSRSRIGARLTFVPPIRGEYPDPDCRLQTAFPFGLRSASRRVVPSARLTVWPKTFPVGPIPPFDSEESFSGTASRSKPGSTGEVAGVRPYRRGDSLRRMHWGQTAKRGRPIVCELESVARPRVLLILDADPAAHTLGTDGTLEWAIRVAASLARGWLAEGGQVGFVRGVTKIPPASGGSQSIRILDALARISGEGSPFAEVLADRTLVAADGSLRIAIASDIGFQNARAGDGLRWIVLERSGFPGDAVVLPPVPGVRPWLRIARPEEVPTKLRNGWAEANHGS